jgi:heptosyltransferase-2
VKAWDDSNWQALAKLCDEHNISYSFQEGFDDLNEYMNWIASNEILVSCDSLGLHLALAMQKRALGLFGPTRESDVHFYNRGEGISVVSDCPKIPCFQEECDFATHCMQTITAEVVFERALALI